MKTMTKLFALGGIGALGAGAYAAVKARRRKAAMQQQAVDDNFDLTDLEEPIVVTEEVFVITEPSYR
jgi:hypothetical protein